MGDFVANLARWRYKLILFVSLVVLCINCIDPYTPNIGKFRSLLVVDALITDEDAPNYVKLSWTTRVEGEDKRAGDALVVISDDSGNSVTLTEKEKGEYWTDPATFRGEVGKSYTLSVVAANGEEYRSNSCLMYPVNEIDSLYYTYHEAVPKGYLDYYEGVSIYADTPAESASGYRRWTYDEWWKFRIPYPIRARHLNYGRVTEIEPKNQICWSHKPSMDINVDIPSGEHYLKHPILFLPSELSNRFQMQYHVEVKQLSISREEYGFWNSMKLLNETGGNIFDRQPYPLYGNVKNVNDPSRNAVGYFQVSSVSSKRIYITADDIDNLGLPKYYYECDPIFLTPEYYGYSLEDTRKTPALWNMFYGAIVSSGYSLYWYDTNTDGSLAGFRFVLSHCADCTLNGQLDPPDFWEDM
jgi:hypothetical protein